MFCPRSLVGRRSSVGALTPRAMRARTHTLNPHPHHHRRRTPPRRRMSSDVGCRMSEVVVCRPTPDDVTKTSTHRLMARQPSDTAFGRSSGRARATVHRTVYPYATHRATERATDRTTGRPNGRATGRTTLRGVTAGGAPGWWTDAPNVRDKKEGVYVCMYVYTVQVQISSGAGATRRVDAPNVRDTGRRVCMYVYTVHVQTDLFWCRRHQAGGRAECPRQKCMSIQYKY